MNLKGWIHPLSLSGTQYGSFSDPTTRWGGEVRRQVLVAQGHGSKDDTMQRRQCAFVGGSDMNNGTQTDEGDSSVRRCPQHVEDS